MIKIFLAHPDEKLVGIYKHRFQDPLRIDSANDGLSAFRQINQIHPQVILSDYDLPIISGVKLLKYIRAHPIMFATPFLFLTNREIRDEVLGLGATDWIHLPTNSPDMVVERTIYYLKQNNQLGLGNISR